MYLYNLGTFHTEDSTKNTHTHTHKVKVSELYKEL